jgi:hypothetical protein
MPKYHITKEIFPENIRKLVAAAEGKLGGFRISRSKEHTDSYCDDFESYHDTLIEAENLSQRLLGALFCVEVQLDDEWFTLTTIQTALMDS